MSVKAFENVGDINIKRSGFNLTHTNTTTLEMGKLTPTYTQFVMPGDHFTIDISSIFRANPLVYPSYVDIDISHHLFFVPYRLLDDNWEEIITGGKDGTSTKIMPKLNISASATAHNMVESGTLYTRLGLVPPVDTFTSQNQAQSWYSQIPTELKASVYPVRAYYQIYNDYYRDENLVEELDYKSLDGSKYPTQADTDGLCKVAWLKDYFSSALPFQQRGTSPAIPFTSSVDISGKNFSNGSVLGYVGVDGEPNNPLGIYSLPGTSGGGSFYGATLAGGQANKNLKNVSGNNVLPYTLQGVPEGEKRYMKIYTDRYTNEFWKDLTISVDDSFTISELRTAFQIQKFMERNARAGVRYTEFLRSHYNVSPTDSRLDRPEFIGGTRLPLIIEDVFQTSETQNTPLGSYAGRMLNAGKEDGAVDYYVEEFGIIMCMSFIRPKTSYFQGINRQWQYTTRFEFPLPEFMHLSEQLITNSEIYIGTSSRTADISAGFGYQGIYDELRVNNNKITGLMSRKDYHPWHLARIFENTPKLNKDFVECNPRVDIFSITDSDIASQFLGQIGFKIKAVRPMPIIAEPGLLDHF